MDIEDYKDFCFCLSKTLEQSFREKEELQTRIDKTIEYLTKIQEKEIEKNYVIDGEDLEYIKDMLKGENND